MYIEIKTDDRNELRKLFDETVDKGQQAMLTLSKDGDFYSLSINTLSVCADPDCLTCLPAASEADTQARPHSVSGLPSGDEQPSQSYR